MSNKALAYSILGVVLAFVAVVVAWNWQQNREVKDSFGYYAYQKSEEKNPWVEGEKAGSQAKDLALGECKRNFDEQKFKNLKMNIQNRQVEILVKDYGAIKIALDDKAAPKTVENFLKLVDSGFYDCLTFHRIAKDFVIQGGDPKGDGTGGPGFTVPAEIKLPHKKGSIAMARLGDNVNPQKESSGSQFYIALNDLQQLDGNYTVFGNVVSGLSVVEKIGKAEILGAGDGPPKQPVVMQSVKIVK